MTDDREPFRTARDAGLKQRHEQRLAHAQAVIPEEAVEAAAKTIRPDLWASSPNRLVPDKEIRDLFRERARGILEAALPHLRGRIGYELGRKEALEQKCGCILGPDHILGDHLHLGNRATLGEPE